MERGQRGVEQLVAQRRGTLDTEHADERRPAEGAIASRVLAQRDAVGGRIEAIVADLEGEAEIARVGHHCLARGGAETACGGPELRGEFEEGARLLRVDALERLETCVLSTEREVSDLPSAQGRDNLRETLPEELTVGRWDPGPPECGFDHGLGVTEHRERRQDGDGLAKLAVYGRPPAAEGGVIHAGKVVEDQGRRMDELDGAGQFDELLPLADLGVGGEEQERGAHPLARGGGRSVHGGGEGIRGSGSRKPLGESFVDRGADARQRGEELVATC